MSTSKGSSMAAKLEEMLQAVWDMELKVNNKLLAMKRKWSPLTIGWWRQYIGIYTVRGLGSLPWLRLLILSLVHISRYLDHGHHQFWGGDCLDLCAYKLIVPVFRRGCSSVRFWSDSWGTGGMMCASLLAALPSVPSVYGWLKFCLMPHNFQSCSNRKYCNILTALHTSLVRGGSPSLCILVLRLSEKKAR